MKKILVIEDEETLREDILELLKIEGFDAIGAENGQVGVQLAQQQHPDLILCDVLMPVLDGYETLRTLRRNSTTALIPFIFLTGKKTAADFRQGLRLGADDYLTKPFERRELLEAIATRLQKQAALEHLQQTVAQLQQVNLFKDDFLSTVSHELRSPLINIMMTVQMLQAMPNPHDQQHYLGMLQEQCSREMTLLNDLLDLQRLEANAHQPTLEWLDLHFWVPAIAESFAARTEEYQQQLQLDLAPDLPPLLSDSTHLERVLSELLSNACKYTPSGGKILLIVRVEDHQKFLCFQVSNEAEIPAADLPRIFEKFYRAATVDFHGQGGSGLGLPLAQKLVEQLGGSLQASSDAGWTTFVTRFPIGEG